MSDQNSQSTGEGKATENGPRSRSPFPRSIRIGIIIVAIPLSMLGALAGGTFIGRLTLFWGSQEVGALILVLSVGWPLVVFRRTRSKVMLVGFLLAFAYIGYRLFSVDACSGSGGASHMCLPVICEHGAHSLLHPQGLHKDSSGLRMATGTPCVEYEISPLGRGLLAAKCGEIGFLWKTIAQCGG